MKTVDAAGNDDARRIWLAAGIAAAVYLAVWAFTVGEPLTYDEAVYVDTAEHLLESTFYPGDLFTRHPPMGLAALAGWVTLDLPLRAWPAVWTLAGVGLLAGAIEAREGEPWLLAPVVASPAILPLVSVTMYPPLFTFLALAAWGWAREHRGAELAGWNLAIITHELALLVLALRLLPRAVALIRRRVLRPKAWLSAAAPYPAALAWGTVMVAGLATGGDPRGGVVKYVLEPTANALAILEIKPLISVVLAVSLLPLLRWPSLSGSDEVGDSSSAWPPWRPPVGSEDWGLVVGAIVAIVASPFYRYLLVLVPLLVVYRAARPTDWTAGRKGAVTLLATALMASGAAGAMTVQGVDPVNAASIPGLTDDERAVELVEPGESVAVRSPPSMAVLLEDRGWQVTATGESSPSILVLERGGDRIVLHRFESQASASSPDVDAALIPASWDGWTEEMEADGWTQTDQAGDLVRLEAPPDRSA